MTTRRLTKEYNLLDLSFEQVLTLAFETASEAERGITGRPLTYEKLALRCGKKTSTMHRYFTDPEYNPPTHILPLLCRSLGNHIIVEWLAVHSGGFFCLVERSGQRAADILKSVSGLNTETTEVVNRTMEALKDGKLTKQELRMLVKDTLDVLKSATAALATMEGVEA